MQIKTHTGRVVDGTELAEAMNSVACDMAQLAKDIFNEDAYASHITKEQKELYLKDGLALADRIRLGQQTMGFWLWQRLNLKLTGECVALLPR